MKQSRVILNVLIPNDPSPNGAVTTQAGGEPLFYGRAREGNPEGVVPPVCYNIDRVVVPYTSVYGRAVDLHLLPTKGN